MQAKQASTPEGLEFLGARRAPEILVFYNVLIIDSASEVILMHNYRMKIIDTIQYKSICDQ